MRDIRFRGIDADTSEWHYGDIVHHDGIVSHICQHPADGSMRVMPLRPETVGQYTGLKDKNGVEIYEGDIVKQRFCLERESLDYDGQYVEGIDISGHHIGQVVIRPTRGTCLRNPVLYVEKEIDDGYDVTTQRAYKNVVSRRCEVIGNVWDSPELLEVAP